MMKTRLRNFLIVPAAVMLLASCGGSEGESDEAKPYVDEMTKSMTEDDDSPMNEEQARCWSEKFVDVVGLERLEEVGEPEDIAGDGMQFTELDLTEDEGNDIYDNFDDCGVDMRDALVEDLQSDDMDPETAQCMEDAITDDNLRAFFVTMMVQGEEEVENSEAGEELMNAFMECAMSGIDMEDLETE